MSRIHPTPLVMIPGMMCDARLFGPQIAYFSGARPLHLATISGADNVEELAREILRTAPANFALLGLSMGGIVAMEIVRQSPERVQRLALLDTNPRAETDEVKAKRRPQMQQVNDGKLSQVMTSEVIPNFAHTHQPALDQIALDEIALDMALDLGAEVFIRQSIALMNRPDQTDSLANYKGKSLVLMGESDRLCPLARHTQMAALLEASHLEIIPQAGHLPTLEQPDATNKAIENWLHDQQS